MRQTTPGLRPETQKSNANRECRGAKALRPKEIRAICRFFSRLLEKGDFISCYVDCDFSSAHLVQDQIRSAKSIREALKLLSKISVPQDREIVVETPRGDVAYDFHADDVELRSQSAESYLQENWESMKADD